jgi:hypothetical protein
MLTVPDTRWTPPRRLAAANDDIPDRRRLGVLACLTSCACTLTAIGWLISMMI